MALGLVAGIAAPAQAGPPPLQVLVDEDLYSYEIQANVPFFGQNGFIVDRATQIAQSLSNCPACTPNPTTPLPAGYTNARSDYVYVDGTTNLDNALADALYAKDPGIVLSSTANSYGGIGTYTSGNRTYAVLILAEYQQPPLDEIPLNSLKITGTARVGAVLTAVVDPTSVTATYEFQWNANGVPFGPKSTSPSIQLTAAQLGKKVGVTLTATQSGSVTRTLSAGPVGPVLPAYIVFPHVITLSGQLYIGQPVGLGADTIRQFSAPGSDLTLRYIWTRNGEPIFGAPDQPTYTLVPRDTGKVINVLVIATARGYFPAFVATHSTVRATVAPPVR